MGISGASKGAGAKKTTKKGSSKTKVGKVAVTKPKAPADWKNNIAPPAAYTPGTYTSEYADRISGALDKVTNWTYDPMQDASYQAMARVYNQRGNIAAKNSLADAAALNGGYSTSNAVSAAQQARNQYNQELAAMIPDFENAAYNRASNTLSALREADESAYGRFRDTETDRQWKYTQDYTKYRDAVGDSQWSWTQQYNKYRDLMSDYQWGMNWNLDYQKYQESKKASSGGGSGGRRSSGGGGGGGYSSSGGGTTKTPVEKPFSLGYNTKVRIWDPKKKKITNNTKSEPILRQRPENQGKKK